MDSDVVKMVNWAAHVNAIFGEYANGKFILIFVFAFYGFYGRLQCSANINFRFFFSVEISYWQHLKEDIEPEKKTWRWF